jgi:outer membrane lipoprotein-sorting protein
VIIGAFPNYSSEKVDEIVGLLVEHGIGPREEKKPDSAGEQPRKPPAYDQAAVDALRAVAEVYKRAESYKYASEVVIDFGGEEPARQTRKITAILKKPNFVQAEIEVDSEKLGSVVCDGKNLWEYNPEANEYFKLEAPRSLAEPTESRLARYVSNVFYHDDPYEAMVSSIEKLSYGGETTTPEGILCKVIIQDYGERGLYRVFADAKTDSVVRVEGEVKGAGPGGSTVTIVERRSSEVNPQLPEDAFAFVPPEGAKETLIVPGPKILDAGPQEPQSEGGEGGQ